MYTFVQCLMLSYSIKNIWKALHIFVIFMRSHRPVDVHNMYNAVQVKLLMKADDLTDIPEYEDVFHDDVCNLIVFF